MTAIVELAGSRQANAVAVRYVEADWIERDNFPTLEQARAYASFKARQYPATPYRIVETTLRERLAESPDSLEEHLADGLDVDEAIFVLEFVPEWRLR